VRPFTEREKEKRETNAIEIHQEHSLVSSFKNRQRKSLAHHLTGFIKSNLMAMFVTKTEKSFV